MALNENRLACGVCDRVKAHVGPKGQDISIAQVKLVQKALRIQLAEDFARGEIRMSDVVAWVEK